MSDPTSAENAAIALDAYEQHILGDTQTTHRRNPVVADALVRGLINDLADYADQRRIDLTAVLTGALEARADDLTERQDSELVRQVGAQVQIRPDAAGEPLPVRRGIITGVEEYGNGNAVCAVRFPGMDGDLQLAVSDLQPAEPFPHTTTRLGPVTTATDAEKTLITVAARIQCCARSGVRPDHDDLLDRNSLAGNLGRWAGTTDERVLTTLTQQINQAAARMSTPGLQPGTDPVRLATTGFPHDLNDGVPAPSGQDPAAGQAPSPEHRPGRAL
ncbi:hypothetical protein DPM19_09550 [Actinomadura craniellae]|uniref:Uncharacterized protein n=1 Tax=Actinomadura craniellae TaxID=2231787 RepID=A0A365H7A4_9ACTN|nr:hypothetical protein [Actinomadura craniellae]RAY14985.1 hypothetical protein DPM19_09550 [Actinomadura craniellae]